MAKERINQFRERYAARMGWCRHRECMQLWQRGCATALCGMCLRIWLKTFGASNA